MNNARSKTLLLLVLDAVSLVAVFNAIAALRGIHPAGGGLVVAPLLLPAVLLTVCLYLIDGYKMQTDMLGLEYASQHAIAILGALLLTLLTTFVFIPAGFPLQNSRAVIALSFVSLAPLSLAYRRLLYAAHARHRTQRSIVYLGDIYSYLTFKDECARAGMIQPILHASSRTGQTAPPMIPPDTGAPFGNILDQISRNALDIEAIILRESSRELAPETSQQLFDLYFNGVPTYTLELFHEVYWRKIPLYRLNQTWLFQEGFTIARVPVFERLKRLFDILLASLALLLSLPVLLAAAAAIWLHDRGPVLFRQPRIGRNRVPFTILKFRTMRPDGPDRPGAAYTEKNDPRITPVGRFLRLTRIDELPQLLNVLKGDMSLIGPRAEWDLLVADYEKQIPCYHYRHLVRPGITGWAQVNYPYGASLDDTLRKLEYDLYYIRHFSFSLDASIVLKTIHVMLFGKGR